MGGPGSQQVPNQEGPCHRACRGHGWYWVVGKITPGLTALKAEAMAAGLCSRNPWEICTIVVCVCVFPVNIFEPNHHKIK